MSSTIFSSGCVDCTRRMSSSATSPSRRMYRSSSGNPPGCFSNATSTVSALKALATPSRQRLSRRPARNTAFGISKVRTRNHREGLSHPRHRARSVFIEAAPMILPLMDFQKIVGWAKGHRNSLVVVAFVFVLAGADLIVNRPKGDVEWLSIPLLAAGLALLVLIFWPTAKPGPRPRGDTIAQRILWKLTVAGRLVPLFPVFGILLIVADLAYNVYASRTPAILTHDQAVLFLGAVLLAYRFVPRRYDRERDFVLLFAGTLSLILVVPLVLLRALSGNLGASVDAYSTYALAPQTSAILNLIGVQNTLVPAGSYDGPGIAFVTAAGVPVQVFITSA